jgi:NTE family protein
MGEKKKVGLALSGGGARGLAHIGVLKVFEKNKIPIDFISGTSMGAFVGAIYSAEPNIKKLEKDFLDKPWKTSFDYNFLPSQGLIKGDKIEKWLEKQINDIEFKDLRIPLFVTAYDLKSKREVIFSRGNVSEAVRASISLPGIFVPVENKGRLLVDGGVVDPIPSEILTKAGAEVVMAVNVNAIKEKEPITGEAATKKRNGKNVSNILDTISSSMQREGAVLAEYDLINKKIDLVINVYLEDVGTLEFDKIKRAIRAGELAAKRSLEEIKKMIGQNLFEFIVGKKTVENIEKIVEPIKDLGESTGLSNVASSVTEIGKKIEKVKRRK